MSRLLFSNLSKKIPKEERSSAIHLSNRGSQYSSHEYINLLKRNEIKVSVGEITQNNAYVERVNGIIKNEYLKYYGIFLILKL